MVRVENPKDRTFVFISETASVQTPHLQLLITSLEESQHARQDEHCSPLEITVFRFISTSINDVITSFYQVLSHS